MIGTIAGLKIGFMRASWKAQPWKLVLSIIAVIAVVVVALFIAYAEQLLVAAGNGGINGQVIDDAIRSASAYSVGSSAVTAQVVESALAEAPIQFFNGVGVLLIVLWWVLTLTFFRIDETLNPHKFSIYGINTAQLLGGLMLANFISFPALATFLLLLILGVAINPLFGTVAAVLGTLTCVIGSRAITSLFSVALSNRKIGNVFGIILTVIMIVAIYSLQIFTREPAQMQAVLTGTSVVLPVLRWTPVGAAFDVSGNVFTLLLAIVYLVALFALWSFSLKRNIENFHESSAVSSVRGLGMYGRVKSNPASAIFARFIASFRSDNRILKSVIMLPIVIVFFIIMGAMQNSAALHIVYGYLIVWMLVFLFVAPMLEYSFSYDGVALTFHFIAGVSAKDECAGRSRFHLYILLPLAIIIACGVAIANNAILFLPAALGGTVAMALLCVGLALLANARKVCRIASARNPLASGGGTSVGSNGRIFYTLGLIVLSGVPYITVGILCILQFVGIVPFVLNCALGAFWLIVGIGGYVLLYKAAVNSIEKRNVMILVDLRRVAE